MKGNRLFTREQENFIKNNVVGLSNKDLTDLVNEEFELTMTIQQVKTWKKNHNLSSGLTGRFEKGHKPVNKGTKGVYNVGGNKTSFKKGQRPHNYKPIGFTRVDRDGYKLVKVCDDGPWHKRWRHVHKILWEKHNGPIPPGQRVIFLNQNRLDIRIENLTMVSGGELFQMNRHGWTSENPEATKIGITLSKVKNKIYERKRGE